MIPRKKIERKKEQVKESCAACSGEGCIRCEAKSARLDKYCSANIPVEYWSKSFKDFEGDPNFKKTIKQRIEDIDSLYDSGKSLIFAGNLGTGKTIVSMEIEKFPKGWSVSIPSEITIDSNLKNGEAIQTVILTVQPPYRFGYHDDRGVIPVKFTPKFYTREGQEVTGESITEYINIENRGFSTPGFEGVYTIFALAAVVLIIAMMKRKKK